MSHLLIRANALRIERPHQPIPRPGRVENHPLFRNLAD